MFVKILFLLILFCLPTYNKTAENTYSPLQEKIIEVCNILGQEEASYHQQLAACTTINHEIELALIARDALIQRSHATKEPLILAELNKFLIKFDNALLTCIEKNITKIELTDHLAHKLEEILQKYPEQYQSDHYENSLTNNLESVDKISSKNTLLMTKGNDLTVDNLTVTNQAIINNQTTGTLSVSGVLLANSAAITKTLTAGTIRTNGAVTANEGLITNQLSVGALNAKGTVLGNNGTINNALYAGSLRTAGPITATTGLIAYGLAVGNLQSAGTINGSSAFFRNNVAANSLQASGTITANTGTITNTLTAGSLHVPGTITGNVTGNLTGNVVGNVQGNVTGNLTGDVAGNVTGNLAGNVTGNVTGNVVGNVQGDVTGDLTGNVVGNVQGNVNGNLTGDVTGNLTGNVNGNLTGDVTGNLTGNVTGAASLNVLKAGDTMTGTLTINPTTHQIILGTTNTTTIDAVAPSSSVTAIIPALSTNDTFVFAAQNQTLTNKTIDAGSNTISNITNSSISNSAAIADTKLATLSSSGKVANSATTATSNNTASAIVARDGSGNFSAGTISANLSGNVQGNLTGNVMGNLTGNITGNLTGNVTGNVTGASSLNVLKTGDTMTGALTVTPTTNQVILGATHTTTINAAAPSASVTATIPALSANDTFVFAAQTQTLTNKTIDAGSNTISNITNSSISSSAAITDTKLATLSTSGKVANSATTATNNNTASAIVARDGSGNFSAGTITANLSGNVQGNLTGNVTGNVTGNITVPAGTAAAPTINFIGSPTTGLSAATTNNLVLSTAGVTRLNIDANGNTTASSNYKMHTYRNATQTITNTTATIIFNTKIFDPNNNFNTTTGVYTAPITGTYCVFAHVRAQTNNTGQVKVINLVRNGTAVTGYGSTVRVPNNNQDFVVTAHGYMNLTAGDALRVDYTTSGTETIQANDTYFSIHFISL